jgi:predicted DNA-binding transcriptional regulator YafY
MPPRKKRRERGAQLQRILKLIQMFERSRYGYTIAELRKELGVTRRTLYRDLAMIEDAGYRFEKIGAHGETRKWRFPPGMRRAADKPYTEQELLSLYFCMNLLQPFRGTPLRDGLESVLQKIEAAFSEEEQAYFGDLMFTHLAKMPGLKSAISKACLSRRCVEVTYRSGADVEAKTYRFHPYCLAYYGGELYTIGYSEHRQSVRTLRVDRIRSIRTLADSFRRPEEFDPEDYLGRSFGMYSEGEVTPVKIEFSNEAARTVAEKEWHPSQRVEQKNGKALLRMSVQGLPEVARWVLYHAPNARVIEPPELTAMVAKFASEAAKIHRL